MFWNFQHNWRNSCACVLKVFNVLFLEFFQFQYYIFCLYILEKSKLYTTLWFIWNIWTNIKVYVVIHISSFEVIKIGKWKFVLLKMKRGPHTHTHTISWPNNLFHCTVLCIKNKVQNKNRNMIKNSEVIWKFFKVKAAKKEMRTEMMLKCKCKCDCVNVSKIF